MVLGENTLLLLRRFRVVKAMLTDEVARNEDRDEAREGGEDEAKVVEGDANVQRLPGYCVTNGKHTQARRKGTRTDLPHPQVSCRKLACCGSKGGCHLMSRVEVSVGCNVRPGQSMSSFSASQSCARSRYRRAGCYKAEKSDSRGRAEGQVRNVFHIPE